METVMEPRWIISINQLLSTNYDSITRSSSLLFF